VGAGFQEQLIEIGSVHRVGFKGRGRKSNAEP
jgi:hypothetical protein